MPSLYERMREHGTLAETPKDIPDATFALPSTVNWMRANAILVADCEVNFTKSYAAYHIVQRKELSEPQINSVFEQLLFSLNQIAALRAFEGAENKADVARVGIVTWYYSIYGAASAMIAAADSSFPETHASTALQWDRIFAVTKLALPPFGDRISSLIPSVVNEELSVPRARGKHSLTSAPTNAVQAWGCHAEYLSGTASWHQWNIEQRVRQSKEFKALAVDSFRTKAARQLRDEQLSKKNIGYLHQAARYRGKANYRDAIYLAYGKSVPEIVEGLITDLTQVASGFSAMAAAYCARRMGHERWTHFIDDLNERRSISLSPLAVWA